MLKQWRTDRKLTLAEAAALLGICGKNPARTYQRYETGERSISDPVLIDRIEHATDGKITATHIQKWRLAMASQHSAPEAAE